MFEDKKAKNIYTKKKFGGFQGLFEQQDGHLNLIIISSVTEVGNSR